MTILWLEGWRWALWHAADGMCLSRVLQEPPGLSALSSDGRSGVGVWMDSDGSVNEVGTRTCLEIREQGMEGPRKQCGPERGEWSGGLGSSDPLAGDGEMARTHQACHVCEHAHACSHSHTLTLSIQTHTCLPSLKHASHSHIHTPPHTLVHIYTCSQLHTELHPHSHLVHLLIHT